jgi:phage shock protein PspC (stress-responsive transcriptional regulator)
MVAGVAAGIAEHLDLDVTLVRILLVVLAFIGGLTVPLYIAAWLLIPDEGAEMSVAEDLIDQFRSR